MGKTNLLDAIHYLSFCKSHTNTPDNQIIRSDEEMCVVQGLYDYEGRDEAIFCAIRRRQRKQFRRNKKEYDKLSEHIGLLPLVMVSPADSDLIRGGSEERRRFLDVIISQQDKPYLHGLIQYNKALLQRNALLKAQCTDASLYEVLEMQLGMYGRMVYEKRLALVEEFTPLFNAYYQTICRSTEQVGLHYISSLEADDLPERLAANRERDRILGYTSSGVHKDELEMTLDGALIRRTGSQGQNKTYLIALKLAQFMFLAKKGQTTPILLLDDIFDKLDAVRVEEIIKLVSSRDFGQIFITDTNRKYLDAILAAMNHAYALFRVEKGEVFPMGDSADKGCPERPAAGSVDPAEGVFLENAPADRAGSGNVLRESDSAENVSSASEPQECVSSERVPPVNSERGIVSTEGDNAGELSADRL